MTQRLRMTSSGRLHPALFLALILPLLAITARLVPGPRMIDDSYITFRYARNIVQGLGFVYNPGEHVMGTTTPLYTLLMAALGVLTGSTDFPLVALVVNALFDALSTLLMFQIIRRVFHHWAPAAVLGLLWALAPHSVNAAIGGMESSLYILTMTGAWATWLWGKSRWAAALTALAVLTRPDALIWAGPLGLAMIWDRIAPLTGKGKRPDPALIARRLPWAEGGIFAAIMVPWLIFSTAYFGNPLTQSIAAKIVTMNHEDYSAGLVFVVSSSIPFFEQLAFGLNASILGLFIYPTLALIGTIAMIRADWRTAPAALFVWLYVGTFAITNFTVFQWYNVPRLAGWLLCIVAGAWVVCRWLAKGKATGAMLALGLIWAAFSLNAWTLHPGYAQDRPMPRIVWNEIVLVYQDVSKELGQKARPGATVAATDIGVLGWESNLRVLDTVGLVSPEALPYYPLAPMDGVEEAYVIPPDLIIDLKPDYVMIMRRYGETRLLKDPRFISAYRLIQTRTVDPEWGDLLVYERQTP